RVELVTVDDDEVGAAEDLQGNGLRGRGVEREESARVPSSLRDGLDRDLELAEEVLDLPCRSHGHVGTRSDDDLRLAARVDVNERDSGRLVRRAQIVVDARVLDPLQGFFGKRVLANGADHPHLCPAPRGRGGLVGSLPPREALEARIGTRFTWLRQALATRDEVEVDR